MIAGKADDRLTISKLAKGLYSYDQHSSLSDRHARRYHPFSIDFDMTPLDLDPPSDGAGEEVREVWHQRQSILIDRLKLEFGAMRIDEVVANTRELGPKQMSLISRHNKMYEEARRAFVAGYYYPSLVASCALGERILNHLILDLRKYFTSSPHFRKVHGKHSFDNWQFAVTVLRDWDILISDVEQNFLELGTLRHRSIHFNPETYVSARRDALNALQYLGEIISRQFGYLRGQPWYIPNTPGAQFISRAFENHPFVKTYLIPVSGFVGPLYGMHLTEQGTWHHLDYDDYGDTELTDEDFATALRNRKSEDVVTIEMIKRGRTE